MNKPKFTSECRQKPDYKISKNLIVQAYRIKENTLKIGKGNFLNEANF